MRRYVKDIFFYGDDAYCRHFTYAKNTAVMQGVNAHEVESLRNEMCYAGYFKSERPKWFRWNLGGQEVQPGKFDYCTCDQPGQCEFVLERD